MIKWISIGVAVVGLAIAVVAALTTSAEAPEPELASRPSIDPFRVSVAATGIVEGSTRNVRISPPEAGLVRTVAVEVGDEVAAGDELFTIDARPLEARLIRERAEAASARARLERLEAEPRDDDVARQEARVARLRAEARDARDAYEQMLEADVREAAGEREVTRRRFASASAEAALAEAEAELTRLREGAWAPELEVARADVARAEAQAESTGELIDRRTVRAPIAGTVVKRNIEPGENASPRDDEGALVLADLSTLVIRAQINEEDIPDFGRVESAVARPRSRTGQEIPLELHVVEPLAIPKTSLTGAPTELVDTRVLEALFTVAEAPDPRIYPGQLVDVFIELAPEEDDGDGAGGGSGGAGS